MTSLFNAFSRNPFSLGGRDCSPASSRRATQSAGEAEYQAVFATTVLMLAGSVAVVLTALAHAF